MTNPQIENGHLDLANEIVDKLCRFRIPGEEWLILWTILRKTYAWHKKSDAISITQFESMTGMKRGNVYRSIKSLLSKKIIGVIKSDNSNINIYNFNKHFHEWTPVIKSDTPIIKSDNKSVIKSDTHKRKERNTTSSTFPPISKKANTPNPEIKTFFDSWATAFKEKFSQPYVFNGPKEGALIKKVLQTLKIDDLQTRMNSFFSSNDDFIKKSGYSIGCFISQINKPSLFKKPKWG